MAAYLKAVSFEPLTRENFPLLPRNNNVLLCGMYSVCLSRSTFPFPLETALLVIFSSGFHFDLAKERY